MNPLQTRPRLLALANQLQAVFFLLFRVMGMGVGVVITQNLGAGKRLAAQVTGKAALVYVVSLDRPGGP